MNDHFLNPIRPLLFILLILLAFSARTPAQSTNGPSVGASTPSGTQTNNFSTGDTLAATILSYQSQEEIGDSIGNRIAKDLKKHQCLIPGNKGKQPPENVCCKSENGINIYITTELQNVGGSLIQYEQDEQQLKQLDNQFFGAISNATYDITNIPAPTINEQATTNSAPQNVSTNMLPTVVVPALTAAAGFIETNIPQLVSAVSSVLGLFSTTTTLNGVPISPNNLGVIPSITEILHTNCINASYVDLYADTSYIKSRGLFHLLNVDAAFRTQSQILVNLLLPQTGGQASGSSNAQTSATINNNTVTIYPSPTSPVTAPNSSPPATNASISFTNLTTAKQMDYITLTSLNSQYDSLFASIMNSNVLSSLMEADFFENNVKGRTGNYLLYINVLYDGGNDLIKSNPIWNLFTDGPRYYYAGGSVVAYILVDSSGAIVVSGVARDLDRYRKVGNSWWYFTPFHRRVHDNLDEP